MKLGWQELNQIKIRPVDATDVEWVRQFLAQHWGSARIISRGEVHLADRLPGFLPLMSDRRVGLVTYRIDDDGCEIVTLNSLVEGSGVGTALLSAVRTVAVSSKCRRVWLITTNDNLEALRFYQRKGFSLVALHRNALDVSRKLKPEIPLTGRDGIPLRDELELEMLL
jgi:ribosomal protein S18 acetylase RimI-like enzyme